MEFIIDCGEIHKTLIIRPKKQEVGGIAVVILNEVAN